MLDFLEFVSFGADDLVIPMYSWTFSVVRNAHFTVFHTMEWKGLRLRSTEFTRFRTSTESDRHIFHTMEC